MFLNDIQSLELTNNTYNEKNTSITGRTFVADFGNNYWSIRIKTVPMTRATFASKFLQGVGSTKGLFYGFSGTSFNRIINDIQIPFMNTSASTASGTVTVSSDSSTTPSYNPNVGSDTVAVTGGTGTIKAGDLIKFSGHSKIYMLTEDVNLDGSTKDTISFTPRLIKPVGGNTITYTAVNFSAIPDGDVLTWQVGTEELYEFEVTYREVI